MSKIKVVNLLDDFTLGGVSRGLAIFESAAVRAIAECRTQPINSDAMVAPALDADIIITHFPASWRRLIFLSMLRARNPKALLLHVEHSYSADWERLHVPHRGRFRMMMKLALSLVDHVVCVSKRQAQWLIDDGMVNPAKLDVIYPSSQPKGLDEIAYPDFDPSRPLVIGAYGRFHDAKGFDVLIEAFKRLDAADNLILLLGGFGPEEEALKALAAHRPNIMFAGKITDLPAYLAQCDVIAVPSRYEAYGQVANEAREAGRPIIVSEAGGLPEQVGEAGLVVDCNKVDDLLAALQTLRLMPLAHMARAGRAATHNCGRERALAWSRLITTLAANSTDKMPQRTLLRHAA
jgi:glycosyltransferase involved in cell wall biosynthesis